MKSRPILTYCALAYGITWLLVLPLALEGVGWQGPALPPLWHGLGALGPVLAAYLVRRSAEPGTRLGDVYRRAGPGPASRGRSVFFVLTPVMLLGLTLLGISAFGPPTDFGRLIESVSRPEWVADLVAGSVLYGLGEEPGWRGWLLPHLQSRRGPVAATLLVSLIWAGWHLPFFAYRFDFGPGMLVGFFIGLLAGAFWLTFVYNSTGGSVWVVALWHLLWNVSNLIAAEIGEAAVGTLNALMMVVGYGVLAGWGRRGLTLNDYGGQRGAPAPPTGRS